MLDLFYNLNTTCAPKLQNKNDQLRNPFRVIGCIFFGNMFFNCLKKGSILFLKSLADIVCSQNVGFLNLIF